MILYIISAILEISACYLFSKGNYPVSILLLILFAWSLTLQPYEPAKAYVIYGGIYILASVIFATMSGTVLSIRDYFGIGMLLVGVLVML